jgi:hypothetical protein
MVENRQKDTQMRPGTTKRTSTLVLVPMKAFSPHMKVTGLSFELLQHRTLTFEQQLQRGYEWLLQVMQLKDRDQAAALMRKDAEHNAALTAALTRKDDEHAAALTAALMRKDAEHNAALTATLTRKDAEHNAALTAALTRKDDQHA